MILWKSKVAEVHSCLTQKMRSRAGNFGWSDLMMFLMAALSLRLMRFLLTADGSHFLPTMTVTLKFGEGEGRKCTLKEGELIFWPRFMRKSMSLVLRRRKSLENIWDEKNRTLRF